MEVSAQFQAPAAETATDTHSVALWMCPRPGLYVVARITISALAGNWTPVLHPVALSIDRHNPAPQLTQVMLLGWYTFSDYFLVTRLFAIPRPSSRQFGIHRDVSTEPSYVCHIRPALCFGIMVTVNDTLRILCIYNLQCPYKSAVHG
jgi:hypothetical protein